MTGTLQLSVHFNGEVVPVEPGSPFTLGRSGDLVIDDNPHLHRTLLRINDDGANWWVANVGQVTPVSIATEGGEFQALLGPGGRMPVVFPHMRVMFTAGPTTYELALVCPHAPMHASGSGAVDDGDRTRSPLQLTESQRMLVAALAEEVLRTPGIRLGAIPTSAAAAERLGWPLTTFNRKLDAICDKLDRAGVDGLRGGPGQLASMRKARLVEYAVLARLVTEDDLVALEAEAARAARRAP